MYLLKLRRDERVVPSTLLWTAPDLGRRGKRTLAEAAAEPAAAPAAPARRDPGPPRGATLPRATGGTRPRHRPRPGHLREHGRHGRGTEPARGGQDGRARRACATCRPVARSASSPPTGRPGSWSTRRPTWAGSARRSTGSSRRARRAISATPSSWRASSPHARATRRSWSATDGALATAPTASVDAPITVLSVGRSRKNQAIVALAVRTAPSAVTRSVFVSVANLDLEGARRRLEVWGDGGLLEVRDLLLDPQARSDVVIDDVPREIGTLELRLVGAGPGRRHGARRPRHGRSCLGRHARRIGPGRSCSSARATRISRRRSRYLPNVSLYGVAPDRYPEDAARQDGRDWDLIIFEGPLPDELPRTPILAIAPTDDEPARRGHGHAGGPGHRLAQPGRTDPPLRRPVDDAHRGGVADGAPRLGTRRDPGPARRPPPLRGQPRRIANRGSRLRAPPIGSAAAGRLPDPPRQPHGRAAGWLDRTGRGGPAWDTGQPDHPVRSDRDLRDAARRHGRRARPRDGTRDDRHVCGDGAARHLHGHATRRTGRIGRAVRRQPERRSDREQHARGKSVRPRRFGFATTAGRPERARAVRRRPVRHRRVDDRAGCRRNRGATGNRPRPVDGAGHGRGTPRPSARDELWIPIVLLVLLVLSIEWAVYHRDAVIRIRRGFATRLGRGQADGSA